MPYFQCFFVDEDDVQYPFYPFSPLQMWGSCSLRSAESEQTNGRVGGTTFSVELIYQRELRQRSQPPLIQRRLASDAGLQQKALDDGGEWKMQDDGQFLHFLDWLSSNSETRQPVSFLSNIFFVFEGSFFLRILHEFHDLLRNSTLLMFLLIYQLFYFSTHILSFWINIWAKCRIYHLNILDEWAHIYPWSFSCHTKDCPTTCLSTTKPSINQEPKTYWERFYNITTTFYD